MPFLEDSTPLEDIFSIKYSYTFPNTLEITIFSSFYMNVFDAETSEEEIRDTLETEISHELLKSRRDKIREYEESAEAQLRMLLHKEDTSNIKKVKIVLNFGSIQDPRTKRILRIIENILRLDKIKLHLETLLLSIGFEADLSFSSKKFAQKWEKMFIEFSKVSENLIKLKNLKLAIGSVEFSSEGEIGPSDSGATFNFTPIAVFLDKIPNKAQFKQLTLDIRQFGFQTSQELSNFLRDAINLEDLSIKANYFRQAIFEKYAALHKTQLKHLDLEIDTCFRDLSCLTGLLSISKNMRTIRLNFTDNPIQKEQRNEEIAKMLKNPLIELHLRGNDFLDFKEIFPLIADNKSLQNFSIQYSYDNKSTIPLEYLQYLSQQKTLTQIKIMQKSAEIHRDYLDQICARNLKVQKDLLSWGGSIKTLSNPALTNIAFFISYYPWLKNQSQTGIYCSLVNILLQREDCLICLEFLSTKLRVIWNIRN